MENKTLQADEHSTTVGETIFKHVCVGDPRPLNLESC